MKPEAKIGRIESAGIDILCIRRFDKAFANTGRDAFMECLLTCLDLKALVAGPDHYVGRRHEGGIPYLRETGAKKGFDLRVVPKARLKNKEISSQRIRRALKAGRIEEANAMLGCAYRLSGHVVSGAGRGRSLGFPTLNIEPDSPSVLIPAHGVYCVDVEVEGQKHPAVCNIGLRPTFAEKELSLEVHVIGERLDSLYGRPLGIRFGRYLRDERKFDSKEALKEQIKKDINQCKKY
ncbi:MAG: riboflavin biosynthesis protein RibF [Candidatus Marinimicrobia bacterium]|nr:riboflavin biosynthesis protein RibF [Candidatus Neomarinimicrobiota bacterium]